MEAINVRYAIGRTIRQRRKQLGLTLAQFGEQMERFTGNASWAKRPDLAHQAELGTRAFTAVELVAIAHVLRMRTWTLLQIDPGEAELVDLGGELIPVKDLQPFGDLPDPDSAANQVHEVATFLKQMSARADSAEARLDAALAKVDELGEAYRAAHAEMVTAREAVSMFAEVVSDADWLIHKLDRDVARFAHGSTTTRLAD